MNILKPCFLVFLFFLTTIFVNKKVNALNAFELSLLGIGAGFVGIQYFDTSLNSENIYKQKTLVINKYLESNSRIVSSDYFRSLPIQNQLVLIEELENF